MLVLGVSYVLVPFESGVFYVVTLPHPWWGGHIGYRQTVCHPRWGALVGSGYSRALVSPGHGIQDEEDRMAAIDPVCGMKVEESDAPDKLDHEGTTYYFCSTDCRQEFEANPGDYAS